MSEAHHHNYLSARTVFFSFIAVGILGTLTLGMEWMDKTAFFGLLLAFILVVLASEKVDKTILVMLGSGLCLFLGIYADLLHPIFPTRPLCA